MITTKTTAFFFCLLWATIFHLVINSASAQNGTTNDAGQGLAFSLSVIPIYQFQSNLDGGGEHSVSRYVLSADARTDINDTLKMGFGLRYDFADHHFSGDTVFAGQDPWENVHRLGFNVDFTYRPARTWSLNVTPSFTVAGETDADWDDALIYGATVSASSYFSRNLMLGAGVAVFEDIEESQVFPFFVIFWQINDHLRLSNPFRPGPAGPAGLELAYIFDNGWEVAIGSAYRSFRFRLDDDGFAPDGVGEIESFPVFGRISKSFGLNTFLDLYAGASLYGELTVEDKDGRELIADERDPAAFAALSFTVKF
jgi:hypothetical protein